MKVKEIMLANEEFCCLDDNIKKAAEIMQKQNCAEVAVLNHENVVIGIITQENICKAVAEFEQKNSAIKIKDIVFDEAIICENDEKIENILKLMRKKLVKRLIVTGQKGQPIGIITLSILLNLSKKKKKLQKKVFTVFKSLSIPQPIVLRQIDSLEINN